MATLEVTDSAGVLVATVTNPLTVRTTDRASAIGDMACTLYVGSPGATAITPGAYLRWIDGSYQFWGIVESVTRAEQEDGSAVLAVTASDIARELARFTTGPIWFAAGSAPVTLSSAINTALAAVLGPTWTPTVAGDVSAETVYLAGDGASSWTMLLSIVDKIGAFIARGAGRTFTVTRTFTASGVTARSVAGDKPANVAALFSLQNALDARDAVSHIYPFTAGNAAMRLSLGMATAALPAGIVKEFADYPFSGTPAPRWYFLRNTTFPAGLGRRERVVQFPEISPLSNSGPDITTAANALQAAAARYLLDHAAAQRTLQLVMDDAPTIVMPGQTIHVTHGEIDGDYRILEATHTWAPNAALRSSLALNDAGGLPMSSASEAVRSMEQARTYAAHAQLAPNVYQLSYTKPVDAQYSADFRFRFDEGITQVLMVALDVQLQPLQSTVRAIGAQAVKTSMAATHTHYLRLAAHQHFMGNHAHTFDNITHTHTVPITRISGSDLGAVRFDIPPAALLLKSIQGSGVGTVDNWPTSSNGTSGGTTSSVGAAVPTGDGLIVTSDNANYTAAAAGAHEHTVDMTVTMEYGIYRDSTANAFALADLEYQINSGAWAALSGATSMGDGWYRIALTNALVDAVTFYPLAKSNRVSIRALAQSAAEETFVAANSGAGQFNRWNDAGTYQQQITGAAATAIALSPNGWLYILRRAVSPATVEVYAPDASGAWSLWDTVALTINVYNAITVDARTGAKWAAGNGGQVVRLPGTGLPTIAGAPTLIAIAASGGNVYTRSTGTLYRINTNAPGSPVTSMSAVGTGLAARNDGRMISTSTATAAFAFRVYESDLSGFVDCVRNDTGNVWTVGAVASAANLAHVGCSDGKVRTYILDLAAATATLIFTSPGTPGAAGYPSNTNQLGVAAALSSKAAMIDAQLTVRSVVQGIVMT